jgi:hypothetical protein
MIQGVPSPYQPCRDSDSLSSSYPHSTSPERRGCHSPLRCNTMEYLTKCTRLLNQKFQVSDRQTTWMSNIDTLNNRTIQENGVGTQPLGWYTVRFSLDHTRRQLDTCFRGHPVSRGILNDSIPMEAPLPCADANSLAVIRTVQLDRNVPYAVLST